MMSINRMPMRNLREHSNKRCCDIKIQVWYEMRNDTTSRFERAGFRSRTSRERGMVARYANWQLNWYGIHGAAALSVSGPERYTGIALEYWTDLHMAGHLWPHHSPRKNPNNIFSISTRARTKFQVAPPSPYTMMLNGFIRLESSTSFINKSLFQIQQSSNKTHRPWSSFVFRLCK